MTELIAEDIEAIMRKHVNPNYNDGSLDFYDYEYIEDFLRVFKYVEDYKNMVYLKKPDDMSDERE